MVAFRNGIRLALFYLSINSTIIFNSRNSRS
nr:MAG TPA: hypothetical protein [Caudoviricetes sp.]